MARAQVRAHLEERNALADLDFELNPEMAASLVHYAQQAIQGRQKIVDNCSGRGRYVDHLGRGDPRERQEHLLNGLFDLIFVRNRVGAAVCKPGMHLLWRKNAKQRTEQFRDKRLALDESGLPVKLCH